MKSQNLKDNVYFFQNIIFSRLMLMEDKFNGGFFLPNVVEKNNRADLVGYIGNKGKNIKFSIISCNIEIYQKSNTKGDKRAQSTIYNYEADNLNDHPNQAYLDIIWKIDENGKAEQIELYGVCHEKKKLHSCLIISSAGRDLQDTIERILNAISLNNLFVRQRRHSFLFWERNQEQVIISPDYEKIKDLATKYNEERRLIENDYDAHHELYSFDQLYKGSNDRTVYKVFHKQKTISRRYDYYHKLLKESFIKYHTTDDIRMKWVVVEYKYIKGEHYAKNALQIRYVINSLLNIHKDGKVHGDIRACNIVNAEDPSKSTLIDPEYVGLIDYPVNFNHDINDGKRDDGAKAEYPIKKEHDYFSLEFYCKNYHKASNTGWWDSICSMIGKGELQQAINEIDKSINLR
eukprot:TRINITY_DN9459_c0_g1_i1.p1 TRINITY_DN9459_c0_g1~~TRINITY_DN9459_c0_g1_i1.p1  ORF type:complete len:404 (+),score=83.30 TRINITY_DN9459_c0_g1_i1:661-1872(+)